MRRDAYGSWAVTCSKVARDVIRPRASHAQWAAIPSARNARGPPLFQTSLNLLRVREMSRDGGPDAGDRPLELRIARIRQQDAIDRRQQLGVIVDFVRDVRRIERMAREIAHEIAFRGRLIAEVEARRVVFRREVD